MFLLLLLISFISKHPYASFIFFFSFFRYCGRRSRADPPTCEARARGRQFGRHASCRDVCFNRTDEGPGFQDHGFPFNSQAHGWVWKQMPLDISVYDIICAHIYL